MMPNCERCGAACKEKPRRGPQSKYCSDRCRRIRLENGVARSLSHPGQCALCGVSFLGRVAQVYCSKDCRARRGKLWIKPRVCVRCGVEFLPKVRPQKCCCFNCAVAYSAALKRRPACTCQLCGVEFIPKGPGRTTFCSRDCAFGRPKAENATAWIERAYRKPIDPKRLLSDADAAFLFNLRGNWRADAQAG